MQAGDPMMIPQYVRAASLDELQRRCLELNTKLGAQLHFFDFQKDGKDWVCFYYFKLDIKDEHLKKLTR